MRGKSFIKNHGGGGGSKTVATYMMSLCRARDVKMSYAKTMTSSKMVPTHRKTSFWMAGKPTYGFFLQSRYKLQLRNIQDTKYAHYQRVLEAGNQAQSRPFSVPEDLWKDVPLIRFVKSTKFTQATAGEDFLSSLTVSVDEVSEYSRPTQEVDVFSRKISSRWEVSLEAALPRDLTEKQMVKPS